MWSPALVAAAIRDLKIAPTGRGAPTGAGNVLVGAQLAARRRRPLALVWSPALAAAAIRDLKIAPTGRSGPTGTGNILVGAQLAARKRRPLTLCGRRPWRLPPFAI